MAFGDAIRRFQEKQQAQAELRIGRSQARLSREGIPALTAKGRRKAQLDLARAAAKNLIAGTIRTSRLRLKKPVITEQDIPVRENFKIPPPVARGKFIPNTQGLKPVPLTTELRKRMRREDI